MRKAVGVLLSMALWIAALGLTGCGGGDKTASGDAPGTPAAEKETATRDRNAPRTKEQVKRMVQDRMKKMQDRIPVMNDGDAVALAAREAKKWDRAARLYYMEGEDGLEPAGTARKWSAYFAVEEDQESTPDREHGKKFVVLMMGGKIVSQEKKETPGDISHTKDNLGFLPDDRMNAEAAYEKCRAALQDKYGEQLEKATPKRLECYPGQYYISREWIVKPSWRLTMDLDGSPISAAVHAVTGEALKVK